MNATVQIFKREFFGYFRSPVAYVVLVVFIVASIGLAWFPGNFFESNEASLRILFMFMPWIFLFLVPAVGMRLWAEEKRSGTWELLFTLPVSVTEAVIGKFLAGWAFISIAILGTFTMPVTTSFLGDPDWGPMIAGYFGAIMMAGAYLSVCSLASSFTKNQVVGFVVGLILCMIILLMGWGQASQLLYSIGFSREIVEGVANFSFLPHYQMMTEGLIALKDIAYFILFSGFCLLTNILILER
jgi:ABC-2 type transport system permease protein